MAPGAPNTLIASVAFSFQGEHHTLAAELEVLPLTELLGEGEEGAVHRLIAQKNGLDTYSYAYEVMEMQPIHYAQASGLIAQFITDGVLDVAAYLAVWRSKSACALQHAAQDQLPAEAQAQLAAIAREHLRIEALAEYPDIQRALLAAYQAGQRVHA
ncbi:MAG: hypothetical protein R3E95_02140 [Thiolinea sp.]